MSSWSTHRWLGWVLFPVLGPLLSTSWSRREGLPRTPRMPTFGRGGLCRLFGPVFREEFEGFSGREPDPQGPELNLDVARPEPGCRELADVAAEEPVS